jgi:hypothetical protein
VKKKVHRLSGTISNHYKLLGISSHENDYRLSWAVNRKLGLNFQKAENIIVSRIYNETEKLEFSLFRFIKEDGVLKINLISNRCPDGFLIREMKNIDYFLQVFGDDTQAFISHIVTGLKSVDIISAVFEIPDTVLKNTRNLPSE